MINVKIITVCAAISFCVASKPGPCGCTYSGNTKLVVLKPVPNKKPILINSIPATTSGKSIQTTLGNVTSAVGSQAQILLTPVLQISAGAQCFLNSDIALSRLIYAISAKLSGAFQGDNLVVTTGFDPDSSSSYLRVAVQTKLEVDEALDLMERVDDWWITVERAAEPPIVITLDFC
jgi:hypothetical protein